MVSQSLYKNKEILLTTTIPSEGTSHEANFVSVSFFLTASAV
jgi:hypothetical protein